MDRVNKDDCVSCTLKHLSAAIVEMGELQKGYWDTDHEIYCEGNLNEASEQIAGIDLRLANQLRALRVNVFNDRAGIKPSHIKICKQLFWQVKKYLKDEKTIIHTSATPKKPKPCNCGKSKTTENSG